MKAKMKFWCWLSMLAVLSGCAHERNSSFPKVDSDSTIVSAEKTVQDYKKPSQINFLKQRKAEVLTDVLKPIGWSKDGKFAYLIEYADEACGCYSMKMSILDAKKNKELWSTEYNDGGDKKDLTFYWSAKYDSIKMILNKYGIIQNKTDLRLESNVFELDGKQYALNIKSTMVKEPDFGIDVVEEAEIHIKSSSTEIKIADCPISKPSRIMSVMTAGFIRSPFDNLIAIVFNGERIGYEGPPHVVTVDITGFDLAKL